MIIGALTEGDRPTIGLMVNQYEDERSQQIYFLLDKVGAWNFPFNDIVCSTTINSLMANIAKKNQTSRTDHFFIECRNIYQAEKHIAVE